MIHYCFLTGVYPRTDGLMTTRQGCSLVKAGYKVTYIGCDDQPDEITSDGIEIKSTRFKPKGRIDRFLNTKKVVLQLALEQDADVYQISDPEMIGIVDDFKKRGKKVVFNLREFYPDLIASKKYIPAIARIPLAKYYNHFLKKYLPRYDAVFTVTDWIVDECVRRYKLFNIHLLTNFPLVNEGFSLSESEYLARENRVCYEGTIYSISRQEKVFEALSQLPDVKYLLIGKIEDKYQWIKDQPYWSSVEFHDGFSIEDLPSIFGRSTISNVFRDFEGRDGSLGVMKIFESMEAALPVLFADVPLYRKINGKYHCGICVDPNNVQSIKEAVEYLVEHKQEAYEMGQRGREAVIKEFCWEQQAKKYIDVIENINH